MSLGISLSVDARQVKEARKEIEFLNKGLREMENAEIAPDKEGLQATSDLIKKISEDIRRMKGLVIKGETQGGLLKKEQFQEAAILSKRIGQNMAEYTKEITKARTELSKLLAEKAKLERVSPSNASGWVAAQERLEAMKDREHALRTNYERLKRNDPRVQDLARRGGDYTEAIGGYGETPEGDNNAMFDKTVRTLVGAWLLSKAMGAARSSWNKYQQQIELETGLSMRGVDFTRRVSPFNYSAGEEANIAMSLRRTTGAADTETLTRFERFARLSNMDPGQAMGFAGGFYQVTGADTNKQRQALDALLYMGKQAKDGRTEVLLQNINANLLTAFNAQGGKALSDSQVSQVIAQTTAMYNAPGTQGMSSSIYETMQKALQPGGDSIDEILSWDIAGGFDKKGPLTSRDFVDIQRRRARGLNDPTNRKAAMNFIRRFAGNDRNMQILLAQKVLKQQFGMPGSVETAEWFLDNYDRLQGARMPGQAEIQADIAQREGFYGDSTGYRVHNRQIAGDFADIQLGEDAEPWIAPVANLYSAAKLGVSKGLKLPKEMDPYHAKIVAAANKAGIDPNWFSAMVAAESRGNRFAKSTKGASGLAQLMPSTFAEMARKHNIKGDILDPDANLQAGAYYMAEQLRTFKDYGRATIAYNAGPKGNPANSESQAYLEKVSGYYKGAIKEHVESGFPSDTPKANLGQEMIELLRGIKRAIEDRKTNWISEEVRRPMPVRNK